jgi:hypothetical protein
MNEHRLIFVTGLHRSGTSILHRCLSDHPSVSGFSKTGIFEDEGQYLQTVLPRGIDFGGPGKFGFDPQSHMTETHPLASPEFGRQIFEQWAPHWDLSKPVLVEKSPPTLLRCRLFQAMFPDACFVVIIRHPAAAALATTKFARGVSVERLIAHWVHCHDLFLGDSRFLRRAIAVKYEDFAAHPNRELARIQRFCGLDVLPTDQKVEAGVNDAYWKQWTQLGWFQRRSALKWHAAARRFGYNLQDWNRYSPADICSPFNHVTAATPVLPARSESPRQAARVSVG